LKEPTVTVSNENARQPPSDFPADPEQGAARSGGSPSDPAAVKPASVLGMAASFTASMAKFAASGFQRVDAEIHDVRVGRCAECEYFNEPRCKLCGCFTDKKAWLPHEDCPIGRWPV
jgi:hypothetical protein